MRDRRPAGADQPEREHISTREKAGSKRETSPDVTYVDGGVEETFAPELIRADQVVIDEAGAAVHVGEVVIYFAADAFISPGEARKLAEALVELADYTEGLR